MQCILLFFIKYLFPAIINYKSFIIGANNLTLKIYTIELIYYFSIGLFFALFK